MSPESEPPLHVAVLSDPEESLVTAVTERLHAFNRERAPALEDERIFVTATLPSNQVLGGLVAYAYGGWVEVYVLWVEEAARRRGIGARLMRVLEDEARRRGAVGVHTDTFSFQALPFYTSLGYETFGELDGFADGNSRFYLRKRF